MQLTSLAASRTYFLAAACSILKQIELCQPFFDVRINDPTWFGGQPDFTPVLACDSDRGRVTRIS
jgi:hypothetical protein